MGHRSNIVRSPWLNFRYYFISFMLAALRLLIGLWIGAKLHSNHLHPAGTPVSHSMMPDRSVERSFIRSKLRLNSKLALDKTPSSFWCDSRFALWSPMSSRKIRREARPELHRKGKTQSLRLIVNKLLESDILLSNCVRLGPDVGL